MLVVALSVFGTTGLAAAAAVSASGPTYRVARVADGDTIDLTGGQRVRLVQIDTPEVYFGGECYGPQASAITKRLLPPGTLVRLQPDPATDLVDQYGRLLRYVIRARDGLNVNIRLVAVGAAAPYFYLEVDAVVMRYGSRLLPFARASGTRVCGVRAGTRCTTQTVAWLLAASGQSRASRPAGRLFQP